MRVTPDRLDVAEAALEAYAEHLMQYGRAALPPRNDLRRVIEALPERSDAMSDPIKDYARAVAEAVYDVLANSLTPQVVDLDAIIATVPAPVMQRRDWPELTERDLREIAELKLVTTAIYAKHKVPPPDTTEPAPVATPTPDLDPEEVRRALGEYFSGKQYSEFAVDKIVAAAREWLRLREQPAPDVRPKWCNVHQHHKWCEHNGGVMGPTGYAAPDVQAQIDAAVKAYRQDMHECEQIAGRALGYPRYCDDQRNFPDATDADGVCVGEHVAPTIVAELAEKYRAAMSENEHWRTTAKDRISTALADEMVREAVAREREECARVAEWVWDSGNHGAHGGEQANRTAAAIRARSAKGV